MPSFVPSNSNICAVLTMTMVQMLCREGLRRMCVVPQCRRKLSVVSTSGHQGLIRGCCSVIACVVAAGARVQLPADITG
jgi:hypothetical protein